MRRIVDFTRDRSQIVAAATAAVLIALVAALLLVQSNDDEDLASKLACERQYGVGSCVETDQAWVPADNAIPVVTLQPFETPTPRSYSPPPSTPTPSPTSPPPTFAVPTPTPKETADTADKLLFTREGESNGRTSAFTVKDDWVVRYSYSSGDESGGSTCRFEVRVEETDGKDAGFEPITEEGKSGSGSAPYDGSGTYAIDISFTCSETTNEAANPRYRLAVYD